MIQLHTLGQHLEREDKTSTFTQYSINSIIGMSHEEITKLEYAGHTATTIFLRRLKLKTFWTTFCVHWNIHPCFPKPKSLPIRWCVWTSLSLYANSVPIIPSGVYFQWIVPLERCHIHPHSQTTAIALQRWLSHNQHWDTATTPAPIVLLITRYGHERQITILLFGHFGTRQWLSKTEDIQG